MRVRTIEDDFEYQLNEIFKHMRVYYNEIMKDRINNGYEPQTFAEWLWENRKEFGENVYNSYDLYTGIDDSTEKYNYK